MRSGLGLLEPDKPVRHIDTVSRKAEQLPFSHAGMNRRQDNGRTLVLADLE